ncbi:MAG: 4-(cytidine 5'-diphospho)-2-C-methyl-D-erythritol kinase [Lachnospiraceae bacterium]|nr:4-(cytidine 5'-diphospho)-2-C-methyl-D-erythritol kinase [Lachnospiraceae bacterium]
MYLRATAKINLALDVVGKRSDGYHDVRMIMQMTGMYDRLSLQAESGRPGIRLTTNLRYIPVDENNLAVKAASLLMSEAGVTDGLSIHLSKFIPVAAGLAGGSSDAAMTMVGVNRLFHLGLSQRELMERGRKIGADVPFCIMKGTALSEGIGEILTPLKSMPKAHILLCKPNVSVSTKDVYTRLDEMDDLRHPDIDGMLAAIEAGDLEAMTDPSCMSNVLEAVTGARYPVIGEIEKTMKAEGALGAVMSGSGSTVFGIFRDIDKADQCRKRLRAERPQARTFLTWPQ